MNDFTKGAKDLTKGAKGFLAEFQAFATRGNMIDLAVGVIVGGAFAKVTSSLTNDLIMPLIGAPMKGISLSDYFIPLDGNVYATLAEATEAGAAVFAYGKFLYAAMDFIFMAFAVFLLVKLISKLRSLKPAEPAAAPTTQTCPFCRSAISIEATRCAHCTSEIPQKA